MSDHELPAAVDPAALLDLSRGHHGRTVRPLGTREAGGHLVKMYALEAPGRGVTEQDTAAAFGTLTYEILAGATAAVDFLAALDPGTGTSRRERLTHSLDSLHEHELTLRARLQEGLESLGDAVTVHSKAPDRTATFLMTLEGRDAREAQAHLAARDVVAPAGSFYAYEPFTALKLEAPALRAGLAPYNTAGDVDRFLAGLAAFL